MLRGRKVLGSAWAGWLLALGAVVLVQPGWAAGTGKAKEVSIAEMIELSLKRSAFPQDRARAIGELGTQRNAADVRDQRVVDKLLEVALRKHDDLFVRIATVKALGGLQYTLFNVDNQALNKYVESFTQLLNDEKEDALIRTEVAEVFQKTLKFGSLAEERAFSAMLKIAETAGKGIRRTPLILRIKCAEGLSVAKNDPKGKFRTQAFSALAGILVQINLDPLLKESVIRAFSGILVGISADDVEKVKHATVNKIIEIVENRKMDVYIRAVAMKALASLKRAGARGVDRLIPVIQKILAEEDNVDLVVAAVESLGITGDEEALPALKKALEDFYLKEKPANPPDVKIREAIMKTLGHLLAAQRDKRPAPNAAAIGAMAKMLIETIDPQAKRQEVENVVKAAVFSLSYLYPEEAVFAEHKKAALGRLILAFREAEKTNKSALKASIAETLKFISRQPFGEDIRRWEEWFDKAYPGFRVRRKAPK